MAVTALTSVLLAVAVLSSSAIPSFVQVTVVAGAPVEVQVRVNVGWSALGLEVRSKLMLGVAR